MIVYFTGTGNSRYCAELLSDKLGDEIVNSFSFIRKGITAELTSEKPWIFVSPTYAWQTPRIFTDFVRSGLFSGNRKAYFVMTCGNDIGNAAKINQALCKKKGLSYRGTLQVVMPENYIALFNAPEPSEAQKIVDAARPNLENGIDCIKNNLDFTAPKAGIVARLKTSIFNTAFYRFVIKANKFTVSDSCIGCGKCAEGCVMNNIKLSDTKPVWGNYCTHCMACICRCPVSAIEYAKASVGKPRYHCPEYRQE